MSEPVKEATTPQQMRAEIFRLHWHDSLVRKVMDSADIGGWSSEDRYTMLAYYALVEKNNYQARVLDQAMLRPAPQIMAINEAVIDTCNMGHKFAKLPDHPMRNDLPRCPHCLAQGLDAARAQDDVSKTHPEDLEEMAIEAGGVLRNGELCFAPRSLAEFAQRITMHSRLNAMMDFSKTHQISGRKTT